MFQIFYFEHWIYYICTANYETKLKVFTYLFQDTGNWVPCGETGPEPTEFTVKGLTPNHKYKFRVRAVNKEGESEPLETDGFIVAKNPYG